MFVRRSEEQRHRYIIPGEANKRLEVSLELKRRRPDAVKEGKMAASRSDNSRKCEYK